ncbi:MAG: hypothetical protein ABFC24_06295, partial [Methanoregulaceae archaeon]
NESAQWIVLLGFLVSLSLFFLALLINQSTLVGQTTAEGVLEFPKNDIRDTREVISGIAGKGDDTDSLHADMANISLARKNSVVTFAISGNVVTIHFNNGVTTYQETTNV